MLGSLKLRFPYEVPLTTSILPKAVISAVLMRWACTASEAMRHLRLIPLNHLCAALPASGGFEENIFVDPRAQHMPHEVWEVCHDPSADALHLPLSLGDRLGDRGCRVFAER